MTELRVATKVRHQILSPLVTSFLMLEPKETYVQQSQNPKLQTTQTAFCLWAEVWRPVPIHNGVLITVSEISTIKPEH